ncbi:MAG: class I SAM-dependent methyltransferase [Acidiferrobacter sp.]
MMMRTALPSWVTLSDTDATILAHNRAVIKARIRASGGQLAFADYMAIALYDAHIGYYTQRPVFGADGDYVTAPMLSSLFGACLARQAADLLDAEPGSIIEAGGGNGALAATILTTLEALDRRPEHYWIIERSAALRARAQAHIATTIPHLADIVTIVADWPPVSARVILANELIDALPATRFCLRRGQAHQLDVVVRDHGLHWQEGAVHEGLTADLADLSLADGYTSEAIPTATAWLAAAAAHLQDPGLLLLIDYGFPRAEFYHPQRTLGTLMCHFRQHAHDDPLLLPGLQDITTHVDFTALARGARAAGLEIAGYTSQAAFLLALGLAPTSSASSHEQIRERQAIMKLTLPHEMGELFKVLAMGRGVTDPLRGFALRDRRAALDKAPGTI